MNPNNVVEYSRLVLVEDKIFDAFTALANLRRTLVSIDVSNKIGEMQAYLEVLLKQNLSDKDAIWDKMFADYES